MAVSIFKIKSFARFARRQGLTDAALCEAVARAEGGLIDADLGLGVIKQRVGRPGQGRSGGYRVIVFYQSGTRVVFVDGFAKNEKDNIDAGDLKDLRDAAETVLRLTPKAVKALVDSGKWIEVNCDDC
jgi:hypothetical protein